MSTILDALRKLQRERAAQTPDKDLRGSITHESSRSRRRGSGARNLGLGLALLAIAGGGYALYRSGQLQSLLARFSSDDAMPSDEDFAAIERELAEREAAARAQAAAARPESPPVADSSAAPAPVARLPRNAPQPNVAGAPGAASESPEILAERARLEAALANARAAQEAQQQAARAAEAAQQAAANATPPESAATAASPPSAAPPAPPATQKRVVVKRPVMPGEPVVTAKPQSQPKPQAEPRAKSEPRTKPAAEELEARAVPRAADGPAPARAAFPEVWVESIRWHPIAERRVASLRFERQNAPEAREGDIVAGVLVYRIDPGSVELRVGGAQRTVSPGP